MTVRLVMLFHISWTSLWGLKPAEKRNNLSRCFLMQLNSGKHLQTSKNNAWSGVSTFQRKDANRTFKRCETSVSFAYYADRISREGRLSLHVRWEHNCSIPSSFSTAQRPGHREYVGSISRSRYDKISGVYWRNLWEHLFKPTMPCGSVNEKNVM